MKSIQNSWILDKSFLASFLWASVLLRCLSTNCHLQISLSLQMSLSKPFQRGITSAQVFAVKKHNTLPFLKGCYMHWMQSVKRISNNQQIVAADEVDTFFRLVHRLRTTSNSTEFFQAGKELLRKFPNCKKWLQWWLQPGVSSMVFRCKSLMKDDLRLHKSRTSNAIEAFHSALYKLMPVKRQPVSTSLRLLLQVAKRDGIMLMDFYANNIRPNYGSFLDTPPFWLTTHLYNSIPTAILVKQTLTFLQCNY